MDWIGEITLMKDLTATMNITMDEEEEAAAAAAAAVQEGEGEASGKDKAAAEPKKNDQEFPGTEEAIKASMKEQGSDPTPPPVVVVDEEKESAKPAADGPPLPPRNEAASPAPSSYSNTRTQIPIRPALTDKSHEDLSAEGGVLDEEELRRKERKRGGLTKEQRDHLAAYEKERARVRQERVDTLARKLVDRISVWTETDKGPEVTNAFQAKTRLEVENLKMESFGIDILHAIGQTYVTRASTLLRSQKFLGIGGFFSKLRDKGNMVKDTWNTISSALDAQQTLEDMAKAEQEAGDTWDDEKKAEYERRVTGKILTAAWRGSKFEIQSVLRDVCDAVLYDKKIPLAKRLERAQALVLIGDIFVKVRVFLPPSVEHRKS